MKRFKPLGSSLVTTATTATTKLSRAIQPYGLTKLDLYTHLYGGQSAADKVEAVERYVRSVETGRLGSEVDGSI